MFTMNKSTTSSEAHFDEFEISGSTYEPRGTVSLHGKTIDCSNYSSLTELAMICSMCNDSAVDYNVNKVNIFNFCESQLFLIFIPNKSFVAFFNLVNFV